MLVPPNKLDPAGFGVSAGGAPAGVVEFSPPKGGFAGVAWEDGADPDEEVVENMFLPAFAKSEGAVDEPVMGAWDAVAEPNRPPDGNALAVAVVEAATEDVVTGAEAAEGLVIEGAFPGADVGAAGVLAVLLNKELPQDCAGILKALSKGLLPRVD